MEKKELSKLTKEQKDMIEFWCSEGYHPCILDLPFIEKFYRKAQTDVITMFDSIEKEDALRNGGTNAETCWKLLKEKLEKR